MLLDLVSLQREMLIWQRVWFQDALRPLLSMQGQHISDHLYCFSQINRQREEDLLDAVLADNVQGAYQITKYLIELGTAALVWSWVR